MKKLVLSLASLWWISLVAQTGFDAADFMQYREQIKDMTAEDLLEKYPPAESYYLYRTQPTELSTFAYLDSIDLRYELTAYEKEGIRNNHFMVTERLSYFSLADALVSVYSSDLPLFFSSDIVLHAMHASYDEMLKRLEYQLLEPNLDKLVSSMLEGIPELQTQWSGTPELEQAVKDAELFLCVALSLLRDTDIGPEYDDSGNFSKLLNAIREQTQPIMDIGLFSQHKRKLDISQFIPRGHYTEEFWTSDGKRDLSQYFQAMMWLGRVDFMLTPPPVAPGGLPWSDEDILRMNLGALTVNTLLDNSGEKQLFDLHEKIIGFFVGPDDNLNPGELKGIMDQQGYSLTDLLDKSNFEAFRAKLQESDDYGQKIMSNFFIVDADKENPAELPISYRLLGQKFLIDSYVFSEVVYDRVYKEGVEVKRMMPDPLDVLFVLGNGNALPLLEEELEKYHYAYKLEELRYLTESYDDNFWDQSLYNTWLDAIRSLNPPPVHDNLPYFMQTSAWQVKNMNTQLASWSQLRHDNVLYAKQSYTGGTSCSFPHVYVEPVPRLYATLAEFADRSATFFSNELSQLGLNAVPGIISYYELFGDHMRKLETIAEKELRRESFTETDISYLKTLINGYMASGPSINGWFTELFYDPNTALLEDFLVVDVHTQPTDEFGNVIGKVMHVGTGNINMGVFCAGSPCDDYNPVAFVGPVLSFHQHFEYDFNRLTDDQWSDKFWSGERMPRPDWAGQFLAGPEGEQMPEGRTFPGLAYTGTSFDVPGSNQNISYLLAFPNPAKDATRLRFILKKEADVNVDIYNSTGQRIRNLVFPAYRAGEHEVEIGLDGISQGMYHIRMNAGNETKTTHLLKQ